MVQASCINMLVRVRMCWFCDLTLQAAPQILAWQGGPAHRTPQPAAGINSYLRLLSEQWPAGE